MVKKVVENATTEDFRDKKSHRGPFFFCLLKVVHELISTFELSHETLISWKIEPRDVNLRIEPRDVNLRIEPRDVNLRGIEPRDVNLRIEPRDVVPTQSSPLSRLSSPRKMRFWMECGGQKEGHPKWPVACLCQRKPRRIRESSHPASTINFPQIEFVYLPRGDDHKIVPESFSETVSGHFKFPKMIPSMLISLSVFKVRFSLSLKVIAAF
jgi:hypothetical protein